MCALIKKSCELEIASCKIWGKLSNPANRECLLSVSTFPLHPIALNFAGLSKLPSTKLIVCHQLMVSDLIQFGELLECMQPNVEHSVIIMLRIGIRPKTIFIFNK